MRSSRRTARGHRQRDRAQGAGIPHHQFKTIARENDHKRLDNAETGSWSMWTPMDRSPGAAMSAAGGGALGSECGFTPVAELRVPSILTGLDPGRLEGLRRALKNGDRVSEFGPNKIPLSSPLKKGERGGFVLVPGPWSLVSSPAGNRSLATGHFFFGSSISTLSANSSINPSR